MRQNQLLGIGLGCVALYVIWPTFVDWFFQASPFGLLRRPRMAPTRKRTTVGLLNRANDCFANASLQALAALPSFYCYLTELSYLQPESIVDHLKLTHVLQSLISQLNETVTSPKALSPQPVISTIERIYNSRVSRAQHDAHEMLHLILETVEKEIIELRKSLGERGELVPRYVVEGSTYDTIKCTYCGYSKDCALASFLILTLTVPQSRKTDLNSLLDGMLAPDSISDYGCPSCRLRNHLAQYPTSEHRSYAGNIDAIPEEVLQQLPPAKSLIEKQTHMKTLPKDLIIHLNRSIYGVGGAAARNSCKVSVPEEISLRSESKVVKYKLNAAVRHSGTHYMGHYECSRRKNTRFWRNHVNHDSMSETSSLSSRAPSVASSLFSPSISSVETKPESHDAEPADARLPFPPAPCASASVQSIISGATARSAPASPQLSPLLDKKRCRAKKRKEPQFWNISDAYVKEATTSQVLNFESANYLLFYEACN